MPTGTSNLYSISQVHIQRRFISTHIFQQATGLASVLFYCWVYITKEKTRSQRVVVTYRYYSIGISTETHSYMLLSYWHSFTHRHSFMPVAFIRYLKIRYKQTIAPEGVCNSSITHLSTLFIQLSRNYSHSF